MEKVGIFALKTVKCYAHGPLGKQPRESHDREVSVSKEVVKDPNIVW